MTIEGIEGAGKTTLARAITDGLASLGREAVLTAEPGGGPVGKAIRRIVLDSTNPISDRAELLLFEAARAQHVDEKIRPALECGAVVVCDRYADSSLAYQGAARGLGFEAVRCLNDFATGGLAPDLTILLDLPAESGLERQLAADRVGGEELAFHEAVRRGFLALAVDEPERFVVIDASQCFDAVLAEAMGAVMGALVRSGD